MGRRLLALLLLVAMALLLATTASCTAILGDFDSLPAASADSGVTPEDASSAEDVVAADARAADGAANDAANDAARPLDAAAGDATADATSDAGATSDAAPNVVTVVLTGAGAGNVSSLPTGIDCGHVCSAAFPAGTMVRLDATAGNGSTFTGWGGGLCSGTSPCTVTASNAPLVTAEFEPGNVAVTITKSGNGTGTVAGNPGGINCGATCTVSVPYNTVITLTPTPVAPVAFAGWTGGGCTGTGTCVVTVTAPVTIDADFERGTFYTVADGANGTFQQIVNPDGTPSLGTIGPLGIAFAFGDCTYDSGNKTIYLVDGRGSNSLYTVNRTTGAATLVGVHGIIDVFALAYHPPTDSVYGMGCAPGSAAGSCSSYTLYKFNLTNGQGTPVGTGAYLHGMAWDSKRSIMLGINPSAQFLTVNVTSGSTVVTTGGPVIGSDQGMTYDPLTDKFWVINYSGILATNDPNNSLASTQLQTGLGIHTAICYVP